MLSLNADEIRLICQKLKPKDMSNWSNTCQRLKCKIDKIYKDKCFWIGQEKQLELLKRHPGVDWNRVPHYLSLSKEEQIMTAAAQGDLWFLKIVLKNSDYGIFGLVAYEVLKIATAKDHDNILKYILLSFPGFDNNMITHLMYKNCLEYDSIKCVKYYRENLGITSPDEKYVAFKSGSWNSFCYLRQSHWIPTNLFCDLFDWYTGVEHLSYILFCYILVSFDRRFTGYLLPFLKN